VDTRQDDYIEYLTGDNRRIEVLCNQFAAEFLVPSGDFRARLAGKPIHDRAIAGFAELYGVSRETILRRLLDWGRVSQQEYEEKTRKWRSERKQRGGSGGDYYLNRGAYLGEKYIEAVFGNYHRGRISIEQAADFLGEKTRNVSGVEEWLFKQGEAA
jgi:Zn-dependent peptidase ImmA (M78 family)